MTRREPREHAGQRKAIRSLIQKSGLSSQVQELEALVKPAITLISRKARAKDLAIGQSRLGGCPDLPPKAKWPTGKKGPLLFVLQIRLEDIAELDTEGLLPSAGLLSVFSDPYVDEPRVLCHPAGTTLERREWLPTADAAFEACGFDFTPVLQLPPHSSAFVAMDAPKSAAGSAKRYRKVACVLSPEEHTRYWNDVWLAWRRRCRGKHRSYHQLLGYGDDTLYGAQGLGDEVLVAFDSDERAKMSWGDAQRVWTLISRKDLLARKLDRLRVAGG